MLADPVAFQVIARASEARAMKQVAAASPDATTPMPKLDMAELTRATRMEAATPPPVKSEKNESGESSVEASLEDFISQANASFPTSVTADGWDLNTGDVELVDENEPEEKLEQEEQVSAPIQVKPQPKEAPKAVADAVKKT